MDAEIERAGSAPTRCTALGMMDLAGITASLLLLSGTVGMKVAWPSFMSLPEDCDAPEAAAERGSNSANPEHADKKTIGI